MNYSRLLPAAALLAIFSAGCSGTNKTAPAITSTAKTDSKLFVVSVESAAFFRHGPQAGREPDKMLSKETPVKLIRPSFGYSKVEVVATGEQLSEDFRPGPEHRQILTLCHRPVSIVDLTSEIDLPLGVVRVLLGDLAGAGMLRIIPSRKERIPDQRLLRMVLDGLESL